MNYKSICLFVVFFITVFYTQAQPAGKLEFVTLNHSFGRVAANAGTLEYTFYFKNAGRSSIEITRVMPSCKCTVPTWTTTAIAPGASGTIKVAFDPKEESGSFAKHITVNTNGEPQAVLLKITGEVIGGQVAKPKPKVVDFATIYRKKSGSLLFSNNLISFGEVAKGKTAQESLTLYNTADKAVNIDLLATTLPLHISLKASSLAVLPKDSVILTFTFDEVKRKDWGYVHSNFFLATDDKEEPRKQVDLAARIVEDFGELDASTPRPSAKLNKDQHDFGTLSQNATVSTNFVLTNEGKAPLYIRKTKASCGCTASEPQKNMLAPRESTTIVVTFRSGTTQGYQNKSVTIITNDPENAEMIVWISANIEKERGLED